MGCYLSFAKVYLEVSSQVGHFSMKDNELCTKSYTIYDASLCLCYSCYAYALCLMIMSNIG